MKNIDFEEELEPTPIQTIAFAQKLAKTKIKEAGLKNPPIIIQKVIDSLDFKIQLQGNDLGDHDGFSAGDKIIGYNSQKSRVRIRFTIAHELGHILLGHNTADGQRFKINFYSKDPNEVNANAFAAELLVPSLILKKEKLSEMSVTELAKKYDVSDDMMFWRLKTLHLELKVASLDIELADKKQSKWKI